jgi:hypothetical protein
MPLQKSAPGRLRLGILSLLFKDQCGLPLALDRLNSLPQANGSCHREPKTESPLHDPIHAHTFPISAVVRNIILLDSLSLG